MSQVEPFRWFTVGKPTGSVAHKTIFLVGATGSGKSTLVDAMVNYILGVKWDDPFRFKVVPDEISVEPDASLRIRSTTLKV